MDTLKTCADLLQEENSELILQLKVTQELLMKSEVEKEEYLNKYREFKDKEKCNVAIQNDMVCCKNISKLNVFRYHVSRKCLGVKTYWLGDKFVH